MNREYAEAEPFYRKRYAQESDDDKMVTASRLLLTVIGQDKWVEAGRFLRELWEGSTLKVKLKVAAEIFNNAQGCFAPGDPQLERGYELVWFGFRDWALQSPK